MKRNNIIRAAAELIDALRPIVYQMDTQNAHALLGDVERFCNKPTDASRMYLISTHSGQTTFTLLRLRASKLNAYKFRRHPSQRWIARYRNWPAA